MSNPARRVRQPGRTAQGHNKPDCGVCNNGAPGPLGLVVNGMGSPCCIEPFDNGGTAMPLTADAGNCSRSNSAVGPYWCSYTYPMSFGGSNFEWAVTIECVSDGMGGFHVHVGVSLLVFVGGGVTDTIASGDWYSASFPSCGDFDCTFPGGAPGGTLTFDTPGSWCTPGSCGTITWSLNTGNVNPCPQPAAKSCCCGGKPAKPCNACPGITSVYTLDVTGFVGVNMTLFCTATCIHCNGANTTCNCNDLNGIYVLDLTTSLVSSCVWSGFGGHTLDCCFPPDGCGPAKCVDVRVDLTLSVVPGGFQWTMVFSGSGAGATEIGDFAYNLSSDVVTDCKKPPVFTSITWITGGCNTPSASSFSVS